MTISLTGTETTGVVLCNQLRSLDRFARRDQRHAVFEVLRKHKLETSQAAPAAPCRTHEQRWRVTLAGGTFELTS